MSSSRPFRDHNDPFRTPDPGPNPALPSPSSDTTPYADIPFRNESSTHLPAGEVDLASAPQNRGYVGVPANDSHTDLPNQLERGNPAFDSAASSNSNLAAMSMNRGYVNVTTEKPSPRGTSSNVLDSGPSPWLINQERGQRRSRLLIWGCALAIIGLIIIGIVVGVVVSNRNKKDDSTSSTVPNVVDQTDPNDPSSFVKDPKLHQSFYGMAYTPPNSQLPNCGVTLKDVIQDIQLLSQLTKRVRLYGADCNQTALVLEAIKRTNVDLDVWVGNYPLATDNGVAYKRQKEAIKTTIEMYGTTHIAGVTVGNEFMLNYAMDKGLSDANNPVADQGADILIANIKDTRDMLAAMNLDKTIPVGTSDAGAFFNNKVLEAVDYGLSNVHPWFAGVSAETSAAWTAQFFKEQNVDVANTLPNKPQMYIAETGWPTKSSDAEHATNNASTASVENLQIFLDTFVCDANKNGTGYFFFEFFDEPWKDAQFGGVEGWWGLFTSSRKLKNVKIPTCT